MWLRGQFHLLDFTLGGTMMGRAVVQITLFGLLLALVTTSPNKVGREFFYSNISVF